MKVIIIGIPYFAQKLQQQLLLYDTQNKYIFLNMYHKKIDKLKYLFHILNCDVVYIHGGNLSGKSKVVNLALKLNKKIIMNWAGTDVLNAMKLKEIDKVDKRYINRINHYCVSPWLKDELDSIGVKANILNITVIDNSIINVLYKKIKKLSVLTYIGQDKPEFYGINTIIKLANDFPNIEFRVAGLKNYKDISKNIKLLGWTDMDEEYKKSLVYIRTPKHDGMPFSVIEALSCGRIVFYNYKLPYVNYFKDYNDLKEQFEKVIDDFNNNKLDINYKAIEYIKEEFSKEKVLGNLIKVFNAK